MLSTPYLIWLIVGAILLCLAPFYFFWKQDNDSDNSKEGVIIMEDLAEKDIKNYIGKIVTIKLKASVGLTVIRGILATTNENTFAVIRDEELYHISYDEVYQLSVLLINNYK